MPYFACSYLLWHDTAQQLQSLAWVDQSAKEACSSGAYVEELSLALFGFTYAAVCCLTYSWETLMPCQCAATACCAAAVILGVSLPLLSLRLMLLRILLKMGMLECLLCFPEESSLRGCPVSPASKQHPFSS